MASSNVSILADVKQNVGILPEYDVFDNQLITDINAAFSTLHQLGVGPADGFEIEDATAKWSDFIKSKRFNFIRSYVIMKVHVMFDPPSSSIAMDALNKQIAEYEWRINSEKECYGEED